MRVRPLYIPFPVRRPSGLEVRALGDPCADLGSFLGALASMKTASAVAFQYLAADLRALNAPVDLADLAERAQYDELRHARIIARLAHRYGGSPPGIATAPWSLRSPFEIALENAVEGCVRDAHGARVALWQARAAVDRDLREAFTTITVDQARHADLAWTFAEYIEPFLEASRRSIVEDARAAAVERLRAEATIPLAHELMVVAGMPPPYAALALLSELSEHVFVPRAA